MKESLKKQLDAEAKRYAKKNAASDERVIEAFTDGAKWWNDAAADSIEEYEKNLTEAYVAKHGTEDPGIRLYIKKTARLWQMRDRLAAELDMEASFMRMNQGSMKQMKFEVDQRLVLLEKFDRTLTADLTAIGLNFTSGTGSSATPKEDDGTSGMMEFYKNAKKK